MGGFDDFLVLYDEDGNEVEFEFLDLIEYEGKAYVVLLPCDEESEDVIILEVEENDDDTESYLGVEDDGILEAVFGIFKEKFKDEFDFID